MRDLLGGVRLRFFETAKYGAIGGDCGDVEAGVMNGVLSKRHALVPAWRVAMLLIER